MFNYVLDLFLDITLLKSSIVAYAAVAALPNPVVTVTATVRVSWGPPATAFTNPSQGITSVGAQATGLQFGRNTFEYQLFDADLSPAAGGSAETTLAAVIGTNVATREKNAGIANPRADQGS